MQDDNPGLATGVLLLLFGVWVVSRTLVHDSQGFNLVDRIIALAGNGTPKSSGLPGFKTSSQGKGTGQTLQRLLLPLSPSAGTITGNGKPATAPPGYHVSQPGEHHDLLIVGGDRKGVYMTRNSRGTP